MVCSTKKQHCYFKAFLVVRLTFFLRDEGCTVVYCIIVLLLVRTDVTTNRVTIIITIAMYTRSMSVCVCDQNGVCKCVMC